MLLTGKLALITGGGRGIGRSIAIAFAREGAAVVIAARTATEIDKTAQEICSQGHKAIAISADISKQADVQRLIGETQQRLGQIDILVNNAGISKSLSLTDTSMSMWRETMDINLDGVFLCIKAVLGGMVKRKSGNLINIASGAGLRGLPHNAAYAASKAGVVALSQSLAGEVADAGVKVNVICPGPIETEMLAKSANRDFLLDRPANLMPPEDVAGAALFLASDLSGNLTGQTINVRTTSRW